MSESERRCGRNRLAFDEEMELLLDAFCGRWSGGTATAAFTAVMGKQLREVRAKHLAAERLRNNQLANSERARESALRHLDVLERRTEALRSILENPEAEMALDIAAGLVHDTARKVDSECAAAYRSERCADMMNSVLAVDGASP